MKLNCIEKRTKKYKTFFIFRIILTKCCWVKTINVTAVSFDTNKQVGGH